MSTLPPVSSSEARARRLVVTKRQATVLLAAVAVVWLFATIVGHGTTWGGYLQATAEASLVGGLADWFAVTALFRHPLGIPIPHTAIITERKDQFGETLGAFIQESFLTPSALLERVRAARAVDRLSAWVAAPDNASVLAGHVADAMVSLADAVDDDAVRDAIAAIIRGRIDSVSVAPLAGRALQWLVADERDASLIDALLRSVGAYLDRHGDNIRTGLGERPWWLPGAVENRLVDRFLNGAQTTLQDMIGDPSHPLRRDLDGALGKLATDLTTSPELIERGEMLKAEFLERSNVADWAAAAWADAKQEIKAQAASPSSELRLRLASALSSAGTRLGTDPVWRARADSAIEQAANYVVSHFQGEISNLVSHTIARWDAAETSRRLELLLGPDLQYIRINGTVVGGLAGLLLYAIAQVL
jgi:uncharacterized membrane-anchored protein YjiN (DUF445 family)